MNNSAAKAVGELYMDVKSIKGSLCLFYLFGLGLGDGALEMDWQEDGKREWLRHMERQSEDKEMQSSWVGVWCAGESAERGDPEGYGRWNHSTQSVLACKQVMEILYNVTVEMCCEAS